MAHSYVAYIDEAGDEGLTGRYRVPGRPGGASHWLAIGATIWRQSIDLEATQWAREIIEQLPEQRRKKPLHFAELDHHQRLMAVSGICSKPMRLITVIANKPTIPSGVYEGRSQLYHYLCRFLLERVSWLCRDYRPTVREGDGRVKIVFSRKRTMRYEDFREYLNRLRRLDDPGIQIHWPVIDVDGIEAEDHARRYGLQIADIGTSGLMAALEPDLYGNVEPRYARMLKQIVYKRNNNFMSYGTKMFPPPSELALNEQQKEFIRIFEGV